MIFDTHSHYDDTAFDEDRDVLLSSMKDRNVGKIIAAGAEWNSIDRIVALCKKYPFIYPTFGIHPENADELTEERKPLLEKAIKEYSPVAVGEIGLDYHYEGFNKELEKDVFTYQLELAKNYNLPVLVHSRDAAEDTMDLIKAHNPDRKGVIHCFSSSLEMAKEYISMGYYIGIGGVVTFKNAKKLKEVAANIPLSSILLETDCPYMAPTPHRGERNDSGLISYVAEEIASLRGITKEEVIDVTEKNACVLFDIKD